MTASLIILAVFGILVTAMLAIDMGLNRKTRKLSFREALAWSAAWVGLALVFNLGIWAAMGSEKALQFLTGYVIEKSLSVDNLFVFLLIFSCFDIREEQQPKVLKWGILGALLMRAAFIWGGTELMTAFDWMFYIFGAILLVTAVKMARGTEEKISPERNPLVRLTRKLAPVTTEASGSRFFCRQAGALAVTPLFLALLVVEASDLVFAVDSIPAVFAVTLDPFIVFTSNVFAIMGLRSLYFLLAGIMRRFVYLKLGISFILGFVGAKMLVMNLGIHVPTPLSLAVIVGTLSIAVVASLRSGKQRSGTAGAERLETISCREDPR